MMMTMKKKWLLLAIMVCGNFGMVQGSWGPLGSPVLTYGNNGVLYLNGYSTPVSVIIAPDSSVFVAMQSNRNDSVLIYKSDSLGAPVTTFGTDANGFVSLSMTNQWLSVMNFDQSGNLLLSGSDNSNAPNTGWLTSINGTTGALMTTGAPSNLINAIATVSQSNGRILVAGENSISSAGMIVAYTPSGAIDTTFGVNGTFVNPALSSTIISCVIDANDNILVTYAPTNASGSLFNNVSLACILPNGTGFNTAFGTGGIIADLFSSDSNYNAAYVAINNVGNLTVAGTNNSRGYTTAIFLQTYDATGQLLYTATPLPLTAAVIACVTMNAQNQITVCGYSYTNVYGPAFSAQWNADLTLNTNYGTAGIALYGTLGNPSSLIAQPTSVSIMNDGTIYLFGCNGYGQTIIQAVYGEQNVGECPQQPAAAQPGTPDVSVQSPGSAINVVSFSDSAHFGSVLDGYTAVKILPQLNGTSYVVFCNGIDAQIGLVNADYSPITSFGAAGTGLTVSMSMDTMFDCMQAASGDFIVAGELAGAAILTGFQSGGVSPISFSNVPGYAACTAVSQTSLGNFLAIMQPISVQNPGTVYAFQRSIQGSAVNYVVNTSYGADNAQGFYSLVNANGTPIAQPIDDMLVDSNDCLYLVYRVSGTVILEKVNPQGSGFDAVFNNGAPVNTGIIPTGKASIAINSDGTILATAPVTGGIGYALYNGTSGMLINYQVVVTGANLVADATAAGTNFYVLINDAVSEQSWIMCIDETGTLASDFAGGTGIVAVDVHNETQMFGIAVNADGKIVTAGIQIQTDAQNPVMYVFNGYSYISQTPQSVQCSVGTVDITLNPAASGVVDVITALSWAPLAGYAIQKMYPYINNTVLYALSNGTQSMIVNANSDYSPVNSWNGQGYLEIQNQATIINMFVVATGNTAGNVMITSAAGLNYYETVVNPQGGIINSYQFIVGFTPSDAVQQQSMGRTLIAGQLNGNAAVLGVTPAGDLDAEFGNNGIALFDNAQLLIVPFALLDMTIDSLDRVYVAGLDTAGNSFVYRINATGNYVDTNVWQVPQDLAGIINGVCNIVQDAAGNLVLAGATTTGFTIASYSPVDGSILYTLSIPFTGGISLTQMYATADGNIIIGGYTGAGEMVAVRLLPNLTLDLSWNPGGMQPGIFQSAVGSIAQLTDAMIFSNTLNYCIGNDSDGTPYLFGLYNGDDVTPVLQSPPAGVPGTFDLTLAAEGTGFFALDSLDSQLVGTVPAGLVIYPNGSMMIGMQLPVSDETLYQSYLLSLNEDCTLGSADAINLPLSLSPIVLMIDASGNPLAAGSDGINAWLQDYNQGNGQAVTTWPTIVNMASVVGILQQSTGRVVVGGLDDSGTPVLVGLIPYSYVNGVKTLDASFDSSFGIAGRFSFSEIPAMNNFVIDQYNNIIVSWVNSNSQAVTLAQILPNATGLNTKFNTTGVAVTDMIALPASESFIAFDTNDQIIIAVATATGIAARRYNDIGTIENLNFNMTSSALGLTTPVVTQLLVDGQDNIILQGYENVPEGQVFTLRIDGGTAALDLSFNPAGVVPGVLPYTITSGVANIVSAGAIAPDGVIFSVVSSN